MTDTAMLQTIYLFRRLSPERLADVQSRLAVRQLAAGELLFAQGDSGDELYIVETGGISIFAPSAEQPGQEKAVRVFGPGEVLGDMALIDGLPRSMSARAEQPSQLLVLQGDEFRRLIAGDPQVALAAMSGLNDRIRYTTDFLAQVRHWMEHMSSGKYQAPEFQTQVQDWARNVGGADAAHRDEALSALAAEFVQMAVAVREREENLQRQVDELRIEIDTAKRQRHVDEIVESDYFKSLRSQAASLRQKRE